MALSIEDMFTKSRFPGGLQLMIFLLYMPVGLTLALLRVFIGFHAILAATILPKTLFIRRWVLRIMCSILGLVVTCQTDDQSANEPDNQRNLLVANSISVFDHLVLDLLTPNYVLINKPCDGFWSWLLGYFSPQDSRIPLKDCINYFFRDSSVDLVAFPEGTTTNGRAMLRFQDWPFDLGYNIRPVTVKIYRPTLNVAVTLADSRYWQDMFWHLFCPMTMYKVRFLPLQRRDENESTSEFSQRVQTLMCDSSDIVSTKFTLNDKKELIKKQVFEDRRQKSAVRENISPQRGYNRLTDDRATLMCRQVKDVLPDVPMTVIVRDLRITKDVDVTITNLLEGITPYIPESQTSSESTDTTSSSTSSTSITSTPVAAAANKPLMAAVPAKTFSRSPRDRHLSLAERKQLLIENARSRYLEKYGSQNS